MSCETELILVLFINYCIISHGTVNLLFAAPHLYVNRRQKQMLTTNTHVLTKQSPLGKFLSGSNLSFSLYKTDAMY